MRLSRFCSCSLYHSSVRDLDSLVHLLSRLCEDTAVCDSLYENAEAQARAAGVTLTKASQVLSQLPADGSEVTAEELEKVGRSSFCKLTPCIETVTPVCYQ